MGLTKRGYFKKDLKQSWFNKSTEHCKGERALHIVEGAQLSGPVIGLITVFDAILTGKQSGQKLQCLYGNPIANNFFQN